jgi:hypothetical protein
MKTKSTKATDEQTENKPLFRIKEYIEMFTIEKYNERKDKYEPFSRTFSCLEDAKHRMESLKKEPIYHY